MAIKVNPPPLLLLPRAFVSDPEVRSFIEQQNTIIFQLWNRTGGDYDEVDGSKNGVAENKESILVNSNQITVSINDISLNASAIATNTINITINSNNIATNTSNIATNTSNITTNTSNIATNTSNITTNTSNIATNTSNIATNTSNIATNTSNITTNASNIAKRTITYWFYDSDTVTAATPISHTGGAANTYLTNSALGTSSTAYNPESNDRLWDASTSLFDFTSLKLGDTIEFRVDIDITTTAANQEVSLLMSLSEGYSPYEFNMTHLSYKTVSSNNKRSILFTVYMGDTGTINGGARFRFASADNATIKVDGWLYKVTEV
jgi:hypothetical protein